MPTATENKGIKKLGTETKGKTLDLPHWGSQMKRDRSHASEFVRQIRVDKIKEEIEGKRGSLRKRGGSFIQRMRPSLYTYEQCEWHPEHIESISKYTSTSEDERTGMLKVKGSRSMSGGDKGHEAMEETRPHIPEFRDQR